MTIRPDKRESPALLHLTLGALAVSVVGPRDRTAWWLEVAPVLIGLSLLHDRQLGPLYRTCKPSIRSAVRRD
jgi:uncharacterized membrane protein YjdF